MYDSVEAAGKGENRMKAFGNSEFETREAEARIRWGKTEAYKEYAEKTKKCSKEKRNSLAAGLDAIIGEFALCMKDGSAPGDKSPQNLVERLRNHISENYYTCTDEILSGLGQMYIADERFKNSIDKHADGTAAFVSDAIAVYTSKR